MPHTHDRKRRSREPPSYAEIERGLRKRARSPIPVQRKSSYVGCKGHGLPRSLRVWILAPSRKLNWERRHGGLLRIAALYDELQALFGACSRAKARL
jgi:hypothetical protein